MKMADTKYAKLLEEHERGWIHENPVINTIDVLLHEYLLPDLSYNYKLSLKINDDTFILLIDKDTDIISDYGLLLDDGSLLKFDVKEFSRSGMHINPYCYLGNNPPYEAGTVFRYNGKYELALGTYNGKINARINRGFRYPLSIVFNLDIHNLEYDFNAAAGGMEVKPTCSFEYKKDLIDIKVAKSIGLIFEHKIC